MGTNHISGTADHLRCCQLMWTVSLINWWQWSVTSFSHCRWHLSTTWWAWGTVVRVCQRQWRLVAKYESEASEKVTLINDAFENENRECNDVWWTKKLSYCSETMRHYFSKFMLCFTSCCS